MRRTSGSGKGRLESSAISCMRPHGMRSTQHDAGGAVGRLAAALRPPALSARPAETPSPPHRVHRFIIKYSLLVAAAVAAAAVAAVSAVTCWELLTFYDLC